MSLRIFKDPVVPKYKSGKWTFDEETETIEFLAREVGAPEPEIPIPTPTQNNFYKFRYYLNQLEEIIFRLKFARDALSHDIDVITVQDIKDLVLFMAPSSMLVNSFINFLHTKTMDRFLNALVVYMEYFLKVVEYLLIRRDEVTDKYSKIQSQDSVKIKIMLSEYLAQYRLILAREYCKIVLGEYDMKPFHHIEPKTNTSKAVKDKTFQEMFMSFITYFTWVAMHRRSYKLIDSEINRLMRSGHFNMAQINNEGNIGFSIVEEQVLYGKNDKRENFRNQRSPLVQEMLSLQEVDYTILWIGERKYRGTDPRMYQLEKEFVVPDSQMTFIDMSHGILGQPKFLYNTMLVLDWHVVRQRGFSVEYDPYKVTRQPYLELPDLNEYKKKQQMFDPYFVFDDRNFDKDLVRRQKRLFKQRDKIITEMKKQNYANTIIEKCQEEVEMAKSKGFKVNRDKIITEYLLKKYKLRKTKK